MVCPSYRLQYLIAAGRRGKIYLSVEIILLLKSYEFTELKQKLKLCQSAIISGAQDHNSRCNKTTFTRFSVYF